MVGISLFFALINTIAGPYVSTITDEMQASATWSSFASLFIGFIPVLVAVVANPNGVVGEQASATIIVGTICGILLNIVQVRELRSSVYCAATTRFQFTLIELTTPSLSLSPLSSRSRISSFP
jgi:uncharacterized membrane protein